MVLLLWCPAGLCQRWTVSGPKLRQLTGWWAQGGGGAGTGSSRSNCWPAAAASSCSVVKRTRRTAATPSGRRGGHHFYEELGPATRHGTPDRAVLAAIFEKQTCRCSGRH